MRFGFQVSVIIGFLAGVASAQEVQPSPTPPRTSELATPSGAPEPQSPPVLLPESTALPAEPPDLRLPSPSNLMPSEKGPGRLAPGLTQLSPEEQEKNKARLSEVRAIAMRSPRVIGLLQEADSALTDEARREFMRAYYHTLCTQMRKLEPQLKQTINDYERVQIRQLARGSSHMVIASRELQHRDRQRRTRRTE